MSSASTEIPAWSPPATALWATIPRSACPTGPGRSAAWCSRVHLYVGGVGPSAGSDAESPWLEAGPCAYRPIRANAAMATRKGSTVATESIQVSRCAVG